VTELGFDVDDAAFREDRARYEDLFEFAPVSYVITDPAGSILEASRTAGTLLGVDRDRLVGKPITIFVPVENRRQFRRTLLGLAHSRSEADWELELETRDGRRFHAQVNAARSLGGGLRWMIQDVGERVENEHRLRTLASALEERVLERTDELERERARLMAIVEQMPGGLLVVEKPSGRVLTMNEQAQDVLGPVAHLDATSPLGRVLEGDAAVSERVELVTPDGAACTLRVSAGPVRDRLGRITAGVLIFEEIAEQEARQRAERDFVTNAAHELQSPIAAITSAVEVLQAGAKEAPERDLFIEHIEREAQRLVRLTRALLTLSRAQTELEEPRTEVVDLCPMLEAIVGRMEPADDVVITVACPVDLALVANRELLEQLISNVVRNAVKYTESGSIRLEGRLHDGAAEVRVVDTGVGISADALPRVAERFYREDVTREGFGLGLAIVQASLYAMGGELEVASEGIGRGTTVTMTLPLGAKLVAR